MACHPIGFKRTCANYNIVLHYSKFAALEQLSMKLELKFINWYRSKVIWKYRLQYGEHYVLSVNITMTS